MITYEKKKNTHERTRDYQFKHRVISVGEVKHFRASFNATCLIRSHDEWFRAPMTMVVHFTNLGSFVRAVQLRNRPCCSQMPGRAIFDNRLSLLYRLILLSSPFNNKYILLPDVQPLISCLLAPRRIFLHTKWDATQRQSPAYQEWFRSCWLFRESADIIVSLNE